MGRIVGKGTSEVIKEYGDVTIMITGSDGNIRISVSGDGLDEVDKTVIAAKVEYFIEVPRSSIPAYVPEPNTMLSAYAAMQHMFVWNGKGDVSVHGDIGTIPTPYGEDAVY